MAGTSLPDRNGNHYNSPSPRLDIGVVINMVQGSREVQKDGSKDSSTGHARGGAEVRPGPVMRSSVSNVASRISVILLLALILLLTVLVAARIAYDSSEWYANTDRDPYLLAAVPIGTSATGVVYTDYDNYRHFPDKMENAEIAFLDGSGQYLVDPARLMDVDPLLAGQRTSGGAWAVHGTSTGATFVYMAQGDRPYPTLWSVRIDASTGATRDKVEPLPGLNASGFELITESEGDTIHALLWKGYRMNYESSTGKVLYVRSPDGGSTWAPPLELNDGNATALFARMVAHDDVVSILLLGLRDPDRGWNATEAETYQSFDGGETMGPPVVLSGAQLPRFAVPDDGIGLGEDGSMLAYFGPSNYGSSGQGLYHIDPNGTVRFIWPEETLLKKIELVLYADDPFHYRSDVFNAYEVDISGGAVRNRYETLDLDGRVLASWEEYRHDEGHILVTRYVGGRYQGISTDRVHVSYPSHLMYATEILLVIQDPKTMRVETIGKPYDVVYLHSEAEEADYRVETTIVAYAAWTSFALVLATGLVATFARPKPPSWSLPEGTIARILASMAIVLPLFIIAGIVVERVTPFWHVNLNFFGLFYVVQGAMLIEVYARTTFRARFMRALHLPIGLFGMFMVLGFATPWAAGIDDMDNVCFTLILLLWGCFFYLVPVTLNRLLNLSRFGKRFDVRPFMVLGFVALLVMDVAMPFVFLLGVTIFM